MNKMLIRFFLVFKDCRLIMQMMPNYTKNQRNAHRMKSFIKSKQHLDTNTQTHKHTCECYRGVNCPTSPGICRQSIEGRKKSE